MKTLGLVGGISWVSTIDYYRYINQAVNTELGGLQFAKCIVYSLNFGELQEKGWEHAYPLLLSACRHLQAAGAEAIVLCANTAHLYAEQIQTEIQIPIIHIVEATAAEATRQRFKTVGLLGTKATMESDLYQTIFRNYGMDVLTPERQETRDYIQQTLKEELGREVFRNDTKAEYLKVMTALRERGAEGIILGCTEIPLLIGQDDFDLPLLDTTKIHVDAAVRFALTVLQPHR